MLLRKLLYHRYVKVSSQQLWNTLTSVLKDTLRLKILWTRIKIPANSFIETLVNNMKQKINEGALNRPRDFPEHCTKIDISLVVIRFFFSQTNLVFKSNPLFIDILDSLCHSLFTFLPLDFYLYSANFEVYSTPLRLFHKN